VVLVSCRRWSLERRRTWYCSGSTNWVSWFPSTSALCAQAYANSTTTSRPTWLHLSKRSHLKWWQSWPPRDGTHSMSAITSLISWWSHNSRNKHISLQNVSLQHVRYITTTTSFATGKCREDELAIVAFTVAVFLLPNSNYCYPVTVDADSVTGSM